MDKQARQIDEVLPGAEVKRVGEGIQLVLNENAVRFTPAGYPATVIGGRVYVGDGLWPAGSWYGSEFAIKVSSLSVEIAKSNREVYFLREELSSMNASFEAIFNKYTLQNKKINKLNDKLNEVAYAIGTKSELLNNNVLTKSGGLIGIGKSRKLNSDMNTNYFTYATKQDVNSVILGYKSVRIMTSHPSDSYSFSNNNNDIIDSLVIIDKSLFWKNSKFLVLEVK